MLLEACLAWLAWIWAMLPAPVSSATQGPLEPVSPELAPLRIGGFDVSGLIALGIRLVDVGGNEGQFDEDLNLDSGLRLRDLDVEAERRRDGGSVDALRLWGRDVGDPVSAYGIELESGGWTARGRYDRTRYVGNTDSDIHTFDLTRESATFGLTTDGDESGIRNGLELSYLQRDGLSVGTRSAGIEFVGGFPVRRREKRLGLRMNGGTTGDSGVDVSWVAGVEGSESRNRQRFSEPLPSDPAEIFTEDFAADTDGRNIFGELSAATDVGGGRLSIELGGSSSSTTGSFSTSETGFFDPTLPFARDTTGVLNIDGHAWEGSVEYSRPVGDATEVSVRYLHEDQQEEGDLDKTIVLDEMFGDPPSVSRFRDLSEHSSVLDLIELGCIRELSETLDLDLRASYGREDAKIKEVVDLVPIRFFDDTVDEYGAEARLRWGADARFSAEIAAGKRVRPTETTQISTAFTLDDQEEAFVETVGRWRPNGQAALSAVVRYEHRQSDAFDADSNVVRYGITASIQPHERLTADVSFTYQGYDLRSDTNFIFLDPLMGATVTPVTVTFESIQRIWNGSLTAEVTPAFRPRLDVSLATSTGSSAFDHATLGLDLPWSLGRGVDVGMELGHVDFDGRGILSNSDYDAELLLVYLRKRF